PPAAPSRAAPAWPKGTSDDRTRRPRRTAPAAPPAAARRAVPGHVPDHHRGRLAVRARAAGWRFRVGGNPPHLRRPVVLGAADVDPSLARARPLPGGAPARGGCVAAVLHPAAPQLRPG